jgi:dTDP-4-dehydrorhamnose 3,5-epimerase
MDEGPVMRVEKGSISGIFLFQRQPHIDHRGFFMELFKEDGHEELEAALFIQDNIVFSKKGVLRGLHFQYPNSQAKLVSVIAGSIQDVAVDIRRGSPTFGKYSCFELSAENNKQIFIPEGFAHGYLSLEENTIVHYKVNQPHHPECERVLLWNDPAIGIHWPNEKPTLSSRDANGLMLSNFQPDSLPRFGRVE